MKKSIFTLLVASFISVGAFAQACGNSGPAACSPTGGPSTGGFQDPNDIPCIERGEAVSQSIQIAMFTQFNFQGQQSVDSIQIDAIGNLPCGVCWATNKTTNRFNANEDGCIILTGSTNDAAGQYKFAFTFTAWINGGAVGITVPPSLTNAAGIKYFIRVKNNGSTTCPTVDTSANATNLTASASCTLGINDAYQTISALAVNPNPMNSTAVVTFEAEETATYTMSITDITGKIVSLSTYSAVAGANTTTIQRNGLPTGMYFLSLSNDKSIATKRFTITE
jgi:hypothetical protein